MSCGERPQLRWWHHAAILLATFSLLVSRRPDAILNPQFYAEDGKVFFQDAYSLGWRTALLHPYGGYFHAVPRLASALALLVPLYLAPLVLNLIALILQAVPVNVLLSSRSVQWGNLRARALLAGLYVALPNCGELHANITNTQCLLALIALLLLVAYPPSNGAGQLAEGFFFLLFGLSGPYCILLLPIAVAIAWVRSGTRQWFLVAILAVTSMIESWSLLILNPQGRLHYTLGATWARLARILSSQIFLGALLGQNRIGEIHGSMITIVLICIAIGGTAIVVACFYHSGVEIRSLIVFASIVLMASLVSPMIHTSAQQNLWEVIVGAAEEHYWLFPILAFSWSLATCLQRCKPSLRSVAIYLLCVMSIGIVRDWLHPVFKDFHFAESARQFENAPPGTMNTFAENPEGWSLQLVKH